MPCLRSLGKSLRLYNLHVGSQAATIGPIQTATLLQQRASITDIVCEPATGTPAHPFQPISSASTTGDTFVPKGAKLSGHGAHPLARYRYGSQAVLFASCIVQEQSRQTVLLSVCNWLCSLFCSMQKYTTPAAALAGHSSQRACGSR